MTEEQRDENPGTVSPDRVAVISGAARGIGAATARSLAHRGWSLVLIDRADDDPHLDYPLGSAADLAATAAACRSLVGSEQVMTHQADVRDQAALDQVVGNAVARWGRVEGVVAAAGAIIGGPTAWSTDDDAWATMLDINLSGVWRLARATVPHLVATAAGTGRFVAVASAASSRGLPHLAAYSAAKHGVAGLIKAMAAELGPTGVTANAVCPGSTDTAMLAASAAVYDLDSVEEFVTHQPIGRLLRAEEIAATVTWLVDEAPGALNGALVPVDGGMTAT